MQEYHSGGAAAILLCKMRIRPEANCAFGGPTVFQPPLELYVMSSTSHVAGQNVFHLEWCPKYRYNCFRKEETLKDCAAAIEAAAERNGIKLLQLSVMPDHVHAVVSLKPSMSVSHALMCLKGSSSRSLFLSHPNFRKLYSKGHFWSRGSFSRSVGDADLPTVMRYVRENNQRQSTLPDFPKV